MHAAYVLKFCQLFLLVQLSTYEQDTVCQSAIIIRLVVGVRVCLCTSTTQLVGMQLIIWLVALWLQHGPMVQETQLCSCIPTNREER